MNRRSFLRALAVAAACPACASLGVTPARADSAHWSYEGATGPGKWGGVCATGRQQSPLDIVEPVKAALPPLSFDYRPAVSEIVNNGHTIQVNVPPGSFMVSGGARHELVQFHFHRPSEHLIDGKASAMEVHYVHRTQANGVAAGGLAVAGVLLEIGAANPGFAAIASLMPHRPSSVKTGLSAIDPTALLPAGRGYYHYEGSLTIPPCSEDVAWYLLTDSMTLAAADVAAFAKLYPMNARPAQKGFRRFVLVSES